MSRLRKEAGQTTAEYGVVLGVITVAIVVAIGLLSGVVVAELQHVTGLIS